MQLREACTRVLRFYEDAGVGWSISGWFKPGREAGAEVSKEANIHVTDIRPREVLDGAPVYVCPAREVGEEVEVELAFPQPAHREVAEAQEERRDNEGARREDQPRGNEGGNPA